jgi:hypothetical protein
MLVIPFVWSFYAAQPAWLAAILSRIAELESAAHAEIGGGKVRSTQSISHKSLNRQAVWIIPIVVTVVFILAWPPTSPFSRHSVGFGSERIWWNVSQPYFVIWTISTFVGYYMICWIVIRHIWLGRYLYSKLAKTAEISIRPHSDGSNGFGLLGEYVARFTVLAGLILVWLVVSNARPILTADPTTIALWSILLAAAYALLVLALILFSTWPVHKLLRQARSDALAEVVLEVRQRTMPGNIGTRAHELSSLWSAYQLIENGYAEWPFRLSRVKKIVLAAITLALSSYLPLLLAGLIS